MEPMGRVEMTGRKRVAWGNGTAEEEYRVEWYQTIGNTTNYMYQQTAQHTTKTNSANTLLLLPCVIEESQNTLEGMTKTATPNAHQTVLRFLFHLIKYGGRNATNGRIRILLQKLHVHTQNSLFCMSLKVLADTMLLPNKGRLLTFRMR